MEPPEIRIVGGAPTPEEERAAREAILATWREDVAAAVRDAGVSPWSVAARAEATGHGAAVLRARTRDAWRWSGRFGKPTSRITIGRGDAR